MKNACYITLFYNWGTVTPVSWIWCLYMNSDFIFYLTIPFEPSRQRVIVLFISLYWYCQFLGCFASSRAYSNSWPSPYTTNNPGTTDHNSSSKKKKRERNTVPCIYNAADQNIFGFTSFLVIPTNWGSGIKFLAAGHTVNNGKSKTRTR